ncbi:GspH/FimT family pseudopilin [Cellvibrio sp. NN19]|uniref:GspH/FimT family pseudopilin n=1 Tax=Cellvibrio chitinivorans TaxID=3102792 RepID=UPI002B401E26|nr:GspH/FimT family pseudopilin [Cellvibrio sp. NN19]
MRKIKGFTLIELMVTLAVAAIVLGIAIPSFNQTMRNNSSSALGTELAGALNFARAEAVKRAKRVSICASSDGATCLAADNWAKGWLVFVDDAAADNTATVTIGTVIRYWSGLNPLAVVTGQTSVSSTNISFVRFTSTGTLARLDTQGRRFTARVNNCKGDAATQILVGLAGMLSTTKQACP